MSFVRAEHLRDRLLAVVAVTFAATYVGAARSIEDSLLSDAVGAGGVPQGVGVAMGVAALALFVKSFTGAPHAPAEADGDAAASTRSVFLPIGGLVLILIGYGWLLPRLGYAPTVSLLVLACGWLAGAALRAPLLICAAATGPILWALFDKALQVRMPVGAWWS